MDEYHTHQWASKLRKYVLTNDIAGLKTILDEQPSTRKKNISDCDVYGLNALNKSVQLDRSDIVRYLIEECHADPNSLSDSEQAPLELAGINGNLDMMKYLYRHGADIHRQNKNGETYLMQFIKNSPICEFLLSEGVDVNIKDLNKRSALAHAVEENCVRSVELLAKYGVNVNENLSSGINSVAFACWHGNGKLDVLEILLSCGADIYRRDDEGNTYLMQSVHQPVICRFLLSNGLNVNDVNKNNKTALCFAAEKGQVDTMKILLNNAADVNIADNDGNTALHYAVETPCFEQVKLLVKYRADLNKRNLFGLMPIFGASMKGLSDIVDYLAQNAQVTKATIIDAYDLLAAEALKKYDFQHGEQFILKALELRKSTSLLTKSPTIINEIFGKDGWEPELSKVNAQENVLEIKRNMESDTKERLTAINSEEQEEINTASPIDVSTLFDNEKKTMLIQAALIQARIISPYSEAVFETLTRMVSLKDVQKEKYVLEIRRMLVDIAIKMSAKNSQKCGFDGDKSETCSYSENVYCLMRSYLSHSSRYYTKELDFANTVQYLKLFLDYFQHAWLYHEEWVEDDISYLEFPEGEDDFDVISAFTIYRLFMVCSSKEEEKQVQDLVHRLLTIEKFDVKLVNNIHRIYFGMKEDYSYFEGLSIPAMLRLLKALWHEGFNITNKSENQETILQLILGDIIGIFEERKRDYWRWEEQEERERWQQRHQDDDTSKISELIRFLLTAGISLFGKGNFHRGRRCSALELIRQLPKEYSKRYYCTRKETSLQCLAAKVIVMAPEETYTTILPRHLTVFVQIHSGSKCCKNI